VNKETFLKSCVLPPWLWCWLISYLLSLHSQLFYWKSFWDSFSSFSKILESIPELVPSLALFIGVISIFFPHFRAIWLEYKYKLEDLENIFPTLYIDDKNSALEIKNFLRSYYPALQIKVNFLRYNQDPLIYASGYHKTSIALFSNILDMWSLDQDVAKAILLHELGHCRDGDAPVIGAGNFLEVTIKSSLIIVLFFIIPLVLSIINQENTFIISIIPSILSTALMLLVNVINTLFMPIVGIWCAELNADRFMADASDSADAPEEALNKISENSHVSGWLLSLIFHPPKMFRKHMIKNDKKTKNIIVLLLIYPLFDLFQLVIYQLRSLLMFEGTDLFDPHEYLRTLSSFRFPIYAVLILVWPFVSVYWVEFFSGVAGFFERKSYKQYVASAGIMLFLSALLSLII
jgi:Zn-dependent protease with chaperone function